MIVETICNLFFGLASFVVGALPTFPSFTSLNVSLSPILYVFRLINLLVSVKLVGNCLIIILVVYNAKFVWSIFMWVIRKIPTIS